MNNKDRMKSETTRKENLLDDTRVVIAFAVGLAAGILLESVAWGVIAAAGILGLIVSYENGQLQAVLLWGLETIQHVWKRLTTRQKKGVVWMQKLDMNLGNNIDTKKPEIHNLETLGSMGCYAITGGGKTSNVHALLHWLIKYYAPQDVQLFISDLKEGLDFRIYRRLPHLGLPIAITTDQAGHIVDHLLFIMETRAKLFKAVPHDRLCNSLRNYHQINRELGLGLPQLPHIWAIFDEYHNLTWDNSEAEKGLIKIAKEGRAYGVTILCSTQESRANMISPALQAQLTTKWVGYMADPRNYYAVAEVPKEWYTKLTHKVPGRFILNIGGEFRIIQANHVPSKELEALARKISKGHSEPEWTESTQRPRTQQRLAWTGSNQQKEAMVKQLVIELGRRPTVDEFLARFETSERTAKTWIPKVMKLVGDNNIL